MPVVNDSNVLAHDRNNIYNTPRTYYVARLVKEKDGASTGKNKWQKKKWRRGRWRVGGEGGKVMEQWLRHRSTSVADWSHISWLRRYWHNCPLIRSNSIRPRRGGVAREIDYRAPSTDRRECLSSPSSHRRHWASIGPSGYAEVHDEL